MRLKKGQLFTNNSGERVVVSDVSPDMVWIRRPGDGHSKATQREKAEDILKRMKLTRDE